MTLRAERGGYELVAIPGGTFLMGSPKGEGDHDEQPQHEVTLSDFCLGKCPVTNEEYARFLKAHPEFNEPSHWHDSIFNQPRQPVVGVSWDEAQKYCEWAGLVLPTEAQWEYACRARSEKRYSTGYEEADLAKVGWYAGNSDYHLHPVGEKPANDFGLHDMHGNVWEWCQDWYVSYGDHRARPGDGLRGIHGSTLRVNRGGSWYATADFARSAYRLIFSPNFRNGIVGFRPARIRA